MIINTRVRKEQERIAGRLNAEIQLRYQMSLASEKMEMYELFEQASVLGENYAGGFRDGLQAGRLLSQKYKYSNSCEKEAP